MISNDIKLTPTYNGCERQWRDNGWDELLEDVNSFCKIKKITILNMEDNAPGHFRSRRDGKNITYDQYF